MKRILKLAAFNADDAISFVSTTEKIPKDRLVAEDLGLAKSKLLKEECHYFNVYLRPEVQA